MPPTLRSLQRLMRSGSIAGVLAADNALASHPVQPWLERRESGFVLMQPVAPDEPPLELPIGSLAQLQLRRPGLREAIEAELAAHGWPV